MIAGGKVLPAPFVVVGMGSPQHGSFHMMGVGFVDVERQLGAAVVTAVATEYDEVDTESWPTFFTQVPVWVLVSGCSAQAYRLYALLAELAMSKRGKERVGCPKQATLARFLQLSNPRQVATYARELERIGAVRIEEYRYGNGMRRGYKYTVRFEPPSGYEGPQSINDYYAANPDTPAVEPIDGRFKPLRPETIKPSGGAKISTTGDAKKSTTRGASKSTTRSATDSTVQGARSSTVQGALNGRAHGAADGTAELENFHLDVVDLDLSPSVGPVTVPHARAGEEREREGFARQAEAEQVLTDLPQQLAVPADVRRRLAIPIAARLAAGWTHRLLVDRLTGTIPPPPQRIVSAPRFLETRIEEIPDQPPTSSRPMTPVMPLRDALGGRDRLDDVSQAERAAQIRAAMRQQGGQQEGASQ